MSEAMIIGFGRIGQATAKIAQAFGLNILAYDSVTNPALESETCKYVSLDELFSQSDIVSLHCPLFESTQGIINKDSIAKMKDGVMIINTSRGPLVVEQDLADALNSGKVAGAAVDVVSKGVTKTAPQIRALSAKPFVPPVRIESENFIDAHCEHRPSSRPYCGW